MYRASLRRTSTFLFCYIIFFPWVLVALVFHFSFLYVLSHVFFDTVFSMKVKYPISITDSQVP